MKTLEHAWNTGRLYAKDGQQIAAMVCAHGILFNDVSRGIHGLIPLAMGKSVRNTTDLQNLTMFNYDYGNYQMPYVDNADYSQQLRALSALASTAR